MSNDEKGNAVRPRWKDYLQCVWCLSTDWMQGLQVLYRSDKRGPLVALGSVAQTAWFRSHNCRVYEWLDADPDDKHKPMDSGALPWIQVQSPTPTFTNPNGYRA